MTDLEFLNHAEATFAHIEARCDHFNDSFEFDIDNQRNGNMMTLVFSNKSQIIINLQKPLHEIWLASKRGGSHYRCKLTSDTKIPVWHDTKTNVELLSFLSLCANEQSGAQNSGITLNFG